MESLSLLSNKDKLPHPFPEILTLYYEQRLTQKEIAEQMKLSIYTVRQYLSRALYLLRKSSGDRDYKRAFEILYGVSIKSSD